MASSPELRSSLLDPAAAYREARRLSGKVLLDGVLQAPLAERMLEVVNPATLQVIASVPR